MFLVIIISEYYYLLPTSHAFENSDGEKDAEDAGSGEEVRDFGGGGRGT